MNHPYRSPSPRPTYDPGLVLPMLEGNALRVQAAMFGVSATLADTDADIRSRIYDVLRPGRFYAYP